MLQNRLAFKVTSMLSYQTRCLFMTGVNARSTTAVYKWFEKQYCPHVETKHLNLAATSRWSTSVSQVSLWCTLVAKLSIYWPMYVAISHQLRIQCKYTCYTAVAAIVSCIYWDAATVTHFITAIESVFFIMVIIAKILHSNNFRNRKDHSSSISWNHYP